MTNITGTVRRILDDDLTLKKNLQRGVINNSALAKYLKESYNLKGSTEAVLSAVRRYKQDHRRKAMEEQVVDAVKDSTLATRTDICAVTFKAGSAKPLLQKLLSEEDFKLVKSHALITIIVPEESVSRTTELLPSESVIRVEKNLAEIRITLPEKAVHTAGVLTRISNEISSQGINIAEIITSLPEIIIYVSQEDLLRAHEKLLELCRGSYL